MDDFLTIIGITVFLILMPSLLYLTAKVQDQLRTTEPDAVAPQQ